jgi:hypothetical protein
LRGTANDRLSTPSSTYLNDPESVPLFISSRIDEAPRQFGHVPAVAEMRLLLAIRL